MILVILGSYCFTAPFIHEPELHSPARNRKNLYNAAMKFCVDGYSGNPALSKCHGQHGNKHGGPRVSENWGLYSKKRATFMVSFIYIQIATETHFMEHIWIWLSTDFWGSLFSEQPTQFCECKKGQASSKTKGDWALISPEMVESTSFKVGTICQHLSQVSQKNKLCVLFFFWTAWSVAVASHCPIQMIGWMAALSKWRGILLNFSRFSRFSCPWVISRAFYFTHSQWAMWNLILATRRKYVILWYLIWIYLCFNHISR